METPEGPEESPELEVEVPDVPTPEKETAAYDPYDMKWSGLFDYTDIDVYQGKQMAPLKDYIKQAKGMLS